MNFYNYFLKRFCCLLIFTLSFCSLTYAQMVTDGNTSGWATALSNNAIKAFVHDNNDTNDDSFTGGSADTKLVSTWAWVNGNTNDKGDITNTAAVLINGVIYFCGDRTAINGDAQIGFWFFKNGTAKMANGTFAPEHADGDLLILSNFTNGGGKVNLRIFYWRFNPGNQSGYLEDVTALYNSNDTFAFVNSTNQPTPNYPNWTYQAKKTGNVTPPANEYPAGSFFEGQIKLLGSYAPCFASFLMETRNSQSEDASLQDLAYGEYNGKPKAPTVSSATRCGEGEITLSAQCNGGDNSSVRWYTSETGGNPIFTGDSYTVNLTQTTTFYVSCYRSDGLSCESARVPIKATINPKPLVSLSFDPIKCNGDNTTLAASVSSGTAPYTYLWSNGETTTSISVKAGSYSVTVTDSKGCSTTSETINITEPSKLMMEVSFTPILCNGDQSTVTVSASGGTAPYTGTGSFSVSAGTYTYIVKDANGCEVSKEITITEPSKLMMEVSFAPILCNGDQSTVTVSASGGTAPYTGTGSFSVSAGTYTYTVKDANGCEVSKEITITEPSKLMMEVSFTPILCNGDQSTVTVSASGGTAPYTGIGSFSVSSGTYTYTVKDANGCEVSKEITITEPSKLMMEVSFTPILCNGGQSTVTVSASGGTAPYTGTGSFSVSSGTYTYTVKDANGCEVSKEITITEPSKLEVSCSSVNPKCNGNLGSITVTASGGTAPYIGTGTFNVMAGTYTYKVTDANGCYAETTCTVTAPEKLVIKVEYTPILCNGGSSSVTVSASGGTAPYTGTGTFNVMAGTYTYKVTDANGCSDSATITVNQPSALSLTIVTEKLLCYDGTVKVTANASGGTPPYSYLWSNGATTQVVNIGAGNYTVTITDANGCTISKNVEVKTATCEGFTTVTQGGWGAKASGKNWGAYRDANFAAAFPTGLVVGAISRNLSLTSAKAVDDFLPSGSTPRALDKSYVNPGQTYQNVFAGQVVALTLNVRFDEWDVNFSSNTIKLGDLIVNSGAFAGWTVYQVLAEANKVLAGEASMYSASELNAIVDAINNNYDGGKVNLGLLSCPCTTTASKQMVAPTTQAKAAPEVIVSDEVVLYPNPSSGEFNLKFDAKKDSKVLVQIYNAQGSLIGDYSSKVVRNGNKASLYINNPNLVAGLYLVKVKTSTTERTIKLLIRK